MNTEFGSGNLGCSLNAHLLTLVIALVIPGSARDVLAQEQPVASPIVIQAGVPAEQVQPLPFSAGGRSRDGHTLSTNNRFLIRDGEPWFPVMGEFHYSRYPESEWEKEILKMKAGGIQIVSTYIFWIHHEEIEGQFDWSGQRNLRRFIELCRRHGMYVWIRVGPWDHGEVRNGGLPDWLIQTTATRENNPVYLKHVRRFYGEISKEVQGLFWKDGGPIIGVQLENEYSARGPGKGAEHILRLRQLAREEGLDAPFYTITGWDNAVIPSRDVLPLFGGYADGFWWRNLNDLPPTPNYFFTRVRCEENVGDDLHSKRPDIDAVDVGYPYLTAEMGGGMEVAYHRRPLVSADDTAAMEVVKLGSGVTLYGYYMFHGGTNPDGKKTTLQESQATGYPNDLPVKSYDFQAPLGEFGQMHSSYRVLKTLHLFLSDFGTSLAPMTSYFPDRLPESKQDTWTPRVAARLENDHGFIFLNNHERAHRLPERQNLQVELQLRSGVLTVPRNPINIPSDAYTIWPVNLDIGGTLLRYSTAQLLCKLSDPQTYVFFAWPGISPEFAFAEKEGASIESLGGQVRREGGIVYVNRIEPGTQIAMRVRSRNGASVNILVLSREQALNIWKATLAGKERMILSPAELHFDRDLIHLRAQDPAQLKIGFLPALGAPLPGLARDDNDDGVFQEYSARLQPVSSVAKVQRLQDVNGDPSLKMGKEVAVAPDDAAFDTAASWTIAVPKVEPGAAGVFLRIAYEGDVARLYANGKLLTDNFYNGTPWLIGLDRVPIQQWDKLELRILPLREHAPIYLPEKAWPAFPAGGQVVRLVDVQVLPEYEVVVNAQP
ncbi:MAG: beta-galactosidase [Acidobacteriia bacterium]|nr:beta-galactosidase [Terriglobia bacterium]